MLLDLSELLGIIRENITSGIPLISVTRCVVTGRMVLAILLGLTGGAASASPIYAISSSDQGHRAEDLYVVDAITGALTRIGAIDDGSHPVGLQSLAFSPNLGLFGVGHGELYHINTSNGQATEVGLLGVNLKAMVYGANGEVYGAAGNRLYSVDLATGKAKLIGSGKSGSIESLEFDAMGVLYATVDGRGDDSLFRIDPTTGGSTRVGRPGAIGFDDVEGLAFVNGKMYGFTQNGLEISINLNTGFGKLVQELCVGLEATAVDPPDTPQTPEPATLGLAGVALAGLFGWRRMGRAALGPV
jgi:hypothetical protein